MCDLAQIPGLRDLWTQTRGDRHIRVAVVDGPIDTSHPAFDGADLERAPGAWPDEGFEGPLARHGTQVASVLFGQHDGPVPGVAPGCRGISTPGFSDRRRRNSQLEMARAIETAVESGAHVINVSGGELSRSGEACDLLDRAVRLCDERNVLIVAAVGNDGCFCDHVPAALPMVLAVGALDDDGAPRASSNWGRTYQDHGLLAPGEDILTAIPGGGTARASGTSLATPIVSGVAALLLGLQLRSGEEPDPLAVRAALLASADPCELEDPHACKRFLSGKLNIERAVSVVMGTPTEVADVVASCSCGGSPCGHGYGAVAAAASQDPTRLDDEAALAGAAPARSAGDRAVVAATEPAAPASPAAPPPVAASEATVSASPSSVVASQEDQMGTWDPYVYALGILGYDFGTEARRDSFKQLMAPADIGGSVVPANPYDSRQMVDHLTTHPSEANSLIWTLNLELTPIYVIEAVGPYAASVYELLTRLLGGEVAAPADAAYIERVSIPGRMTDRTAKLFSGQVLPVVEVEQVRGLYGWQINLLLGAATEAAQEVRSDAAAEDVGDSLREFLTRVYYDLRNLGATSRDRALNFAATNAFQAAQTFASAVAAGMALDTIGVEKSPFCRMDSDCWDVRLRFFDPENSRRARKVFRFTIDVSDLLPVTLGDVRSWSEAG
jgi:cyanobactin maturation PatA/PatG family protease